jgi:universal stress protein A
LIPCDLTDRAGQALAMAGRLALPKASRLTLLHVIAAIDGLQVGELRAFYERLERKARVAMTALVRRHAKGAGSGAPRAELAVRYGRRAEQIVEFATANDVDLIVLASHRVNPSMVSRDWGSISYKVGILAQCPVLLVK